MTTLRIILLSLLLLNVCSAMQIPAPSGEHAVGRRSMVWTSTALNDPFADVAQPRVLKIDLWYPATANKIPAEYLPEAKSLPPEAVESYKQTFKSAWDPIIADRVPSNSYIDAPIAPDRKRLPVLIFLPGLGMSPLAYSSILTNLASHGYFVFGIEQPYTADAVVLSATKTVLGSPKGSPKQEPPESNKELIENHRIVDQSTADVKFVIDQLISEDRKRGSFFHDHLLLNAIGVFGHSSGGRTAARTCELDSRVKACANIDGTYYWEPFLPYEGAQFHQPFLMLDHQDPEMPDAAFAAHHTTRAAYEAHRNERRNLGEQLYRLPKGGSWHITVTTTGADHGAFSDLRLLQWAGDPEKEKAAIRIDRLTKEVLGTFFGATLLEHSAHLPPVPLREPDLSTKSY